MNKKIYKVAVALNNNGIEETRFVKIEAYDEDHLFHILKTKGYEYRFIDSITEKRNYGVSIFGFKGGIRFFVKSYNIYEEYKNAKLFFNKYALENKYVKLWLCENDGTKICEIESHKPELKTKEEILVFIKEGWGESRVTNYISHDGKQCYRAFGNIASFQDLCQQANLEWKWLGDFQMSAKGSDFELEYCEHDIILAFEK